ncbi:YIP1 family protein [Actibacterium sp. 188UL27-1]|uniref:YIP1 family protein n=1 Tax=Actibacterium sp. 188UL27-1 TaxID=2786961 RepID=UPI001958C681|nr:YIP1 family protein [Actibacterium sp. 188UL27-1]MBM7067534.1 YIP1 family protein [Actibacterium sp. 188UL27-1]
MAETTFSVPDLVRRSFTDARGAARQVIDLNLPIAALAQALVLVVIANVLLEHVAVSMGGGFPTLPEANDPRTEAGYQLVKTFYDNPFYYALVQACLLGITVFAIHVIGRAFDGVGRLEDALGVIVWFQVLLIIMQALQAVTDLILPPLTVFVSFATVILFFYWLTQFVMEVHSFDSALSVLTMIIVSTIGILIAVSLVLAILGVTMIGDVPNV